jgi:hypothetical protein
MMLFTKAQQEFIINERRAHAHAHANMQKMHGKILIGNALPTPKDVWGVWDREAVEIQRDVLAVYNDLSSTLSQAMPIGKLVKYFQTVSDSGSANVSIDGESASKIDKPVYDYHGTPLPIIDDIFGFGWREMMSAQTEGVALDNAASNNSQRKVAEALEDIMLTGSSKIKIGGDGLYGLLNHPKRGTRSTGVTLNGATGAQWEAEIKALLKVLHAKNFRNDVTLYFNWDDWFFAQSTDYSTAYAGGRISQKILEMGGVRGAVPASRIPANTVIAVVKQRSVVQVLNGMPIVTRPLARHNPEDRYNFKVMAAGALEIKFDAEDQCGVAVSS